MSLPYEDDGPTRILGIADVGAHEQQEVPESLDPAKLFTDSVMGPLSSLTAPHAPSPPAPLDVAYLSAPPQPLVVVATRAPVPEPRRDGLGVWHAVGAASVLATLAMTASLLYIYFH